MHNLRHFYYQNKEKIWKVVLIIAFLLGIIYFLDAQVGKNINQTSQSMNNQKINYDDQENKTYIAKESAISGEKVTEKQVKEINETIGEFLKYCKNEKYQEAYSMISEDCKEKRYNTLKKFTEEYAKPKIDKNKVYEIKKWIKDIYRIDISEDILATGNANNKNTLVEYIAIVEENSQKKLNLSGYVGQTDINKETVKNDVKITVINKEVYLDYEIYNFKIENLSNKTIMIDNLQKIGTMHLEDSNGNNYNAYSHEIFEEDLELDSKSQVNVSIKYANTYSSRTNISKIIFEEVILDYNKYKKADNKQEFKETCKITVNLY